MAVQRQTERSLGPRAPGEGEPDRRSVAFPASVDDACAPTFPAAHRLDRPSPNRDGSSSQADRPLLLIVDADPESRNAMRHLFVSAGCRVIEADSGGQAAVQISGQVAVVIARLRSGLPGLDALRELQALHEDVQTLVLADAEAARRCPDLLRERRVECVIPPWRQDELLARLRLAVRIWGLSRENRALRRTACASHPGVANTQDRGCDAFGVEDVREPTTASRRESDSDIGLAGMTLAEIERRAIRETLRACAGHRGKAARSLGVSEKTIYNKIKSYQIRGVH